MEAVGGLAQTLQTYGAWGIVAILMVALMYMWRAYVDTRDRQDVAKDAQVRAAIDLVEEGTRATVESKNALGNITQALMALERRLENVEKKLE